jgi:hypothetical protein
VSWVGGGAAVGFLFLAAALAIRLYRESTRQYRLQESQRKETVAHHRRCQRQVAILIYTLQRAGIEVPETIWEIDGSDDDDETWGPRASSL